jgi:hypothetical protein
LKKFEHFFTVFLHKTLAPEKGVIKLSDIYISVQQRANFWSQNLSLERDCQELIEVTLNLELLITFGMSMEGVCHELYTLAHYKLIRNLEVTKNSFKELPPN